MVDLLMQHASTVLAVIALLAIAVALTARWEAFSLWLLSTWHALPLVGGIAWLARRQAPRRNGTGQSGLSAMYALCSSYARYIRVLSRAEYENYMNYLRKSGDLGRRPFPALLWFVIFSMVIVEAIGFAYVLAGWTLPGASEVLQQAAAGAIGFLVATILVFFTHWAGAEIYQSNQHRRDRREWKEAGRARPLYGADLSLNDPQSVDDNEPAYVQRATRGPGKTTYLLTLVTLVMITSIGVGAAYVRGQVLEQELVVEASHRTRALDRFDLGLSADAARARIDADKTAIQDEIAIKRKGGWGTLIVLVIIFFFLQLLGMFFGYRYCFNGRLSRDAYRALQSDRFSSYSELVQYYDRIADIAQSRLELLQQRLERRQGGLAGSLGVAHYYTFRDYLQMREAQRRDKPIGGEPEPEVTEAAPAPAAALPAPVAEAIAEVVADVRALRDDVQAAEEPTPPRADVKHVPEAVIDALAGRLDLAPPATFGPVAFAPAALDIPPATPLEAAASLALINEGLPTLPADGASDDATANGRKGKASKPLGPILKKDRDKAARTPEPLIDVALGKEPAPATLPSPLPPITSAPPTLGGAGDSGAEPVVDAARILDEAEALERRRAADRARLAGKGPRSKRESEAR